jgi:N-acetylmuramoyl-L-alanine amidase
MPPAVAVDVDTLARTIFGEARSEGTAGMTAVAAVIVNRVDHPRWWGHDVVNVCRTPYQFSCWNKGDPNLAKIEAVTSTNTTFAQALDIASQAVLGALVDPTGGATSYYDNSIDPPYWAQGRTPSAAIGRLIFFRD